MNLSSGTPITHANVFTALTAVIPASSIAKYRISSIVLDTGARASGDGGAVNVPLEVNLGISGNHYQSSSVLKPLKIRLGKDYGDDGMWLVTDGAALSDGALPGNEVTTDPFIALEAVGTTAYGTEMHVRVAWTDPQ